MAFHVGDVVVVVDSVEVMVTIVEEGLLVTGEIDVAEGDLVDLPVGVEEGVLDSSRYIWFYCLSGVIIFLCVFGVISFRNQLSAEDKPFATGVT